MKRPGLWRPLAELTALAAAALLGGCATPQVSTPTVQTEAAAELAGRLLLKVEASPGQPARTVSAAFELQGDEHTGRLRLLSPLGTVLADARWTPGGAWLRSSEGEQAFDDLASLAAQTLGEPLPLGALSHWLRGQPWPAAPQEATPEGFAQLGWQLDLRQWAEAGQIEARRAAPPAVLLRARLAR